MAEYTDAITVVERMAGNEPIEKTFEGASQIKIADGHLRVADLKRVIAVYAPGSWLSAYRKEK